MVRESAPAPVEAVRGQFLVRPKGVILHGSRSGVPKPLSLEYQSTVRYLTEGTGGSYLAWHATIGEREYAVHLPATQWGWNAREHSSEYLAVEFAQPTVGWTVTGLQIEAYWAWYQQEIRPVWGAIDTLVTHAELPAGVRDGKSDVYPIGDARVAELKRGLTL